MIRVFTFCALVISASVSGYGEELRYAENFAIERLDTHRLITVRNTWIGAGDQEQVYALVPKGADLPDVPPGAVIVRTPVERLVIMETVFLGPIQDLQLHDSLVGVAYLEFVSDPVVRRGAAEGRIKRVQAGSAVDVESLMLLRPDLILTSTTGNPTYDIHPQMRRAGLPVVITADYMENHPLARTEWIKFVAEFFGKQAAAKGVFDNVAERYNELAALAEAEADRPLVMSNAPYGGVWHVPGGLSYTARCIEDAGGEYVWSELDSRGGVALDYEVILRQAASADIWLHPSHYDSMEQLLGADPRFVAFKSVRSGNVYNNSLRVNEHGGNDIFERGFSHPEEVLADLVKIFHPELLPDHQFVFYEKLTRND